METNVSVFRTHDTVSNHMVVKELLIFFICTTNTRKSVQRVAMVTYTEHNVLPWLLTRSTLLLHTAATAAFCFVYTLQHRHKCHSSTHTSKRHL
jgi:hypothetical protein